MQSKLDRGSRCGNWKSDYGAWLCGMQGGGGEGGAGEREQAFADDSFQTWQCMHALPLQRVWAGKGGGGGEGGGGGSHRLGD